MSFDITSMTALGVQQRLIAITLSVVTFPRNIRLNLMGEIDCFLFVFNDFLW